MLAVLPAEWTGTLPGAPGLLLFALHNRATFLSQSPHIAQVASAQSWRLVTHLFVTTRKTSRKTSAPSCIVG